MENLAISAFVLVVVYALAVYCVRTPGASSDRKAFEGFVCGLLAGAVGAIVWIFLERPGL